MAKIPRIAVVGSANIDLTTFTDRFPKPGETIFGQKFDLGFGGKGANQATASRLCGANRSSWWREWAATSLVRPRLKISKSWASTRPM